MRVLLKGETGPLSLRSLSTQTSLFSRFPGSCKLVFMIDVVSSEAGRGLWKAGGRAPHGAQCPWPHQPQQRALCDHTWTRHTQRIRSPPTCLTRPRSQRLRPSAPSVHVDGDTISCTLIDIKLLPIGRTAWQFRVGGTLLSITFTECPVELSETGCAAQTTQAPTRQEMLAVP